MANYYKKLEFKATSPFNSHELNLLQDLNTTLLLATYDVDCCANDNTYEINSYNFFSRLASNGDASNHLGGKKCLSKRQHSTIIA